MNTCHLQSTPLLRQLPACGILAVLLLASCEESLPPRDIHPPRVEAAITVADTFVYVRTNVERRTTEVVGSGGSVILTITSHHDEVLQGDYLPAGHVDVWLKKDPSCWERLDVALFHFVSPDDLAPDGTLTLFPEKRIRLRLQWSHRDSAGVPFWRRGERTYTIPPVGYPYYDTEPLQFVAEGTAQLFGEQGALYAGRIQFTLNYRETIIGTGDTLGLGRRPAHGMSSLEILQK